MPTSWPSRASATAVARPMPESAPVMIAAMPHGYPARIEDERGSWDSNPDSRFWRPRSWPLDHSPSDPHHRQNSVRPRCEHTFVFAVNGSDYAYILGMYLGDGCLGGPRPGVQLKITLDGAYPGIIVECADALGRISPNKVSVTADGRPNHNGVHVYTGWKYWPLLFPQCGPGRKHERQIVLKQWQWD